MRIYLASRYTGARAKGVSSQTSHSFISGLIDYPYILESFHYLHSKNQLMNLMRENGDTMFLDSGAFSMFTQNVSVNLSSYAKFIEQHQDIIHVASNLDAIGAGNEQLSYDRQKELEKLGADIKPVHHVRDKDSWLQRYLDEGYDYIFLGGMVPENTDTLRTWLDHVWSRYLTKPDGTPKVKVHGFGLTTQELMFRYPWFSVDSTSWVQTAMFGAIYLDMPQPDGGVIDFKVDFSNKSKRRYDDNSWHFATLKEAEKQAVVNRLEELEAARTKYPIEEELEKAKGYKQGLNPVALGESYGWRDVANIGYFKRAMDRRVDRFVLQQETLF